MGVRIIKGGKQGCGERWARETGYLIHIYCALCIPVHSDSFLLLFWRLMNSYRFVFVFYISF